MTVPVTIENEALRLEVWPQFGGKVSSMVDKADGHELMFSFPLEMPTRCQYGTTYANGWFAGWDECFPGVDSGTYPLHPYENVQVPDHGELWALPTTAVPTRDGITVVWHGLRFGYRLTRKLFLEGPAVVAEYTLINLAPFEFRFGWSLHALLSTVSPLTIDLGTTAHLRDGNGDGETVWPTLDLATSFTRSDELPAGQAWKRFTADPIAATARVAYPQRQRRLDVSFSSDTDVSAYWGVWINSGGWEGHRHVALQPTTSRSDDLRRSIADGSAGRVGPGGRVDWAVRMTVGAEE
ncbi:MAG TPA: hypothetical protein VF595_15305 [Tepidisphaeraceae bacterium]|jgi:hypothetical protein